MSGWWMFVSFYQNVLAVPLAIIVFVLLIRTKSARRRALYGGLIVVLFLPHIQRFAGDYYFDYLCRTQAGEFIYRTVDNVEGILQMRPRDGSKDYFDRMRAGDIPEDPWGHTNAEAGWPWSMIGAYRFIEMPAGTAPVPASAWRNTLHISMFEKSNGSKPIARYYGYDGKDLSTFRKALSTTPQSRFGYTWQERKGFLYWALNIYPGEIQVKELETSETLALKRGFLRSRPFAICPMGKDDRMATTFVQKVLRPPSEFGR